MSPVMKVYDNYRVLWQVFEDAFCQAQHGKGSERHGGSGTIPFHQQPVMEITRTVGLGFPLGQAMKKIGETQRRSGLTTVAQRAELYGAMVYLAAAIIHLETQDGDGISPPATD